MAKKERTIALHDEIKKDFNKLSGVKEKGVIKYSVEYVLNSLAQKYFKSPKTIENIVFNRA
jgi:hypothetical protein